MQVLLPTGVMWEGDKQRSRGNTVGGISPNCIWHFTFIFLAIRRYKVSNPVLNNNVKMLMAPEEPSEKYYKRGITFTFWKS